ncbi:Serine acetyltransferase [hydrothermal vent metagenome]|uniref:Serine acetyltransferase n=1 Tax=hydrothermal vent metagenome TaxID=652676 RepID=A0A3B0T6P8_9ZZZZ
MHILFMLLSIVFAFVLIVAVFFSHEIKSTMEKDPAAHGYFQIILLYPGLHATIAYRVSHVLWKYKLPIIPRMLSQIARFLTGIEIHPGASIGPGLFIDHGMGVVIGETAVLGKDVTLFQGVTLGGTGKETGKRHPTLGDNVVVGTGAKVLGNITIGKNSYVGANAVVLKNVPHNATIVGVPGLVTKQDGKKLDKQMDHVHIIDPVMQKLVELSKRIKVLEKEKKE